MQPQMYPTGFQGAPGASNPAYPNGYGAPSQPAQPPYGGGEAYPPQGGQGYEYGGQAYGAPGYAQGGAPAPVTNPFGAAPVTNPFGAAPAAPYVPSAPGFPPTVAPPTGPSLAPPPTTAEMQQKLSGQFPPDTGCPSNKYDNSGHPTHAAFQAGAAATAAGLTAKPVHPTHNYSAPAVDIGGRATVTEAQIDRFLEEARYYNSGPHFISPTIARPPQTGSLKFKAPLPIGMCIQPLASVPAGYPEVPEVNFGAVGTVIRCKRCRTYINPFVQWEANGRRWICNLCGFASETPNAYYCNLDENGKRIDNQERPELSFGTVEYIAPGEYMVRPPQPPVFLFLIEVSTNAVLSGYLNAAVQAIKDTLESDSMANGDQRLQVGIITYDSSVQFYKVNPNLQTPHMVVVSDLDDLFLPLPDDVLVNATECQASISALLDSLPNIFKETKISSACLGPAIKAAYLAMKHVGGKLMIFSAGIPRVGDMSLSATRENPRLLGSDQEVELLRPGNEAYKELAAELVRVQISAEIFVATSAFYDLPSIAPLAKFTGGDLHYYHAFRSDLHGEQLRADIVRVLTRYTGWEAVMRVRVSRGWKITNFFGHLFVRGVDLLVVPNCHADQTFSVTIDIEENGTPDPVLYIQAALLYTNSDGERRIRVHTYSCPSTQSFQDMVDSIDPQAMATVVANLAMKESITSNLAQGRALIQNTANQIVSAQNHYPSAAVFLPLYLMGLLKSTAFRAGNDTSPDLRIAHWTRLESCSVPLVVAYCYPRMIGLHNLGTTEMEYDEYNRPLLPSMLSLTTESLSHEGIFLLEDGTDIVIWCGRSIDANTLHSIFGISTLDELEVDYIDHTLHKNSSSPAAIKVVAVINAVRAERAPSSMRIQCLRQGDPLEARFFTYLYEDRCNGCPMTYQEFLQRSGQRTAQQPSQPAGPPRG